ncbi:putative vacuolar protein sorting-associated protein 13F [Selaginella moellendorffii]|uniref:putative vacuolar protein sorting-associated protein 13F n=1 Tax=Selaginella moellendorffii TaxID=88036 RepID=UPI000D1C8717|nr:putative vacuolar protein sorting-associated protein 13F [Selaginella moellendorffii]|eukprot:XP_024542534.1 putative vacuolar protein sorting-associated protein 13F [Selaginella moellendorffii]
MFEAHVLYLLRRYLGQYVRGLSAEALQISVWKGDVVLKDLQLKAEALNALRLPLTVKAGFLGSVTLKIPWNKLGKDPVIVLLDRVFVLAEPVEDEQLFKNENMESWLDAKRSQIEELEMALLDAKAGRSGDDASPESKSWLGSLVATIIGNLKVSVTNLHIRYEDTLSNPSHPFCFGVTLAKTCRCDH